MAVFRVERNTGYTVMSNHHLRNKELSLKAKGLLSQMLSLPEDWDYTLAGLSYINREKIDAIREAIKELEKAGYIKRSRERDEKGRLRGADYVIYEQPQPDEEQEATPPISDLPTLENPTLDNPTLERKIKYGFINYPFHSYPFPKPLAFWRGRSKSQRQRKRSRGKEAKGKERRIQSV